MVVLEERFRKSRRHVPKFSIAAGDATGSLMKVVRWVVI